MKSPPQTAFVRFVLFASLFIRSLSASPDPASVKGPEACGECHKNEVQAWQLTPHFKTFNDMHRTPEARAIADKLGISRIKSESLCLNCHYTSKVIDGESQVIAGVSCESCHGAAKAWIDVHNDYGGKGATKATETPEHREARRAKAAAAGMIYPENLYAVAANCYQCHIVTDEKLTNVGGHTAGSADFNLLTWSQGMVRHNFLQTDNKSNAEPAPEHKRMLYVVGGILNLEYSLRAVARATEKATYGITNAHRADAARKELARIQSLAPTDELAAIIAVANGVKLRLNNGPELSAAADKIADLGREFAAKVTGDRLAGIDSILPGPEQYKGSPFQISAAH
ncbi:MAG TPA: cytochrome c family protein [Opitutaceae bacterium]|nr:cytochrome c family protein [Opitutaceae bacterium]